MTRFTDLANKQGWHPLYEGADRHGINEWAYSHSAETLTLVITVAAWHSSPDEVTCESFAGVSSTRGFTRDAVRRMSVSYTDFEESIEVASELMVPAFLRADYLARTIAEGEAQGHTELFEDRFVAQRERPPWGGLVS